VERLLASLRIVPVFSAHPTAPTRRTILRKHQSIVRRLVDMQNPALTPSELAAALDAVRTEVTAIWQTEESPSEARTVFDELEHTLFFLTEVIYRVIPAFYEGLDAALHSAYGATVVTELPAIVRFASWIGGDMDGNTDITARTLRETLARQRSLILNLYHRECRDLQQCRNHEPRGVDGEVQSAYASTPAISARTWERFPALPRRPTGCCD
jgi:phosphoenolpyruvate carboxylase